MAEIDFRSEENVRRWLGGKPREWALVLAARNALRVAPMLRWPGDDRSKLTSAEWGKDVLLPLMRGMLSPWVAAKYSTQGDKKRAAVAAAHARAADAAVTIAAAASNIAVTSAAYAVASNAYSAITDTATTYAAYAVLASSNADSTWRALSLDACALSGTDGVIRLSPPLLSSAPLWSREEWPRGSPDSIIPEISEFEQQLQQAPADEHWDVWLSWWLARFNGGNIGNLSDTESERVEVGILLLPEEVWEQGPKVVNQAIKDMILEAREGAVDENSLPPESSIPAQDQRGISFGGKADVPIELVPLALPDRLLANSDRQEDYEDIRQKADAIRSESENRVGHLMGPIERFLLLSPDLDQVRAQQFWSRVNTLRIKHNGHLAAIEAEGRTGETDERRLDTVVADLLSDLVETINAFHLGDPKLAEFDAARPGPREIAQLRAEFAPILPLLGKVADNSTIVSAAAGEALQEGIADVQRTGDSISERQAVEAGSRTLRNFITALLERAYRPIKKAGAVTNGEASFAWKEIRSGAYKAAGASGIGAVTLAIGASIASNKAAMISYVSATFPNNPALARIIEVIAKIFGAS